MRRVTWLVLCALLVGLAGCGDQGGRGVSSLTDAEVSWCEVNGPRVYQAADDFGIDISGQQNWDRACGAAYRVRTTPMTDEESAATTWAITGSLDLVGYGTFDLVAPGSSEECVGIRGFSEIGSGMRLLVRDESNELLGTADLQAGVFKAGIEGSHDGQPYCQFTFRSTAIPKDRNFYTIESGSRGGVTLSNAEMSLQDWSVTLTLSAGD